MHVVDYAALRHIHCAGCGETDPEGITCHHCNKFVCGDCVTPDEQEHGVCLACFGKELARFQKVCNQFVKESDYWRGLAIDRDVQIKRLAAKVADLEERLDFHANEQARIEDETVRAAMRLRLHEESSVS